MELLCLKPSNQNEHNDDDACLLEVEEHTTAGCKDYEVCYQLLYILFFIFQR